METDHDSGTYALAGFLFQLFATGADALQVHVGDEKDTERNGVFFVERFGQDAATESSLIQYKFSSVGDQLKRSHVREILESFFCTLNSSGILIDDINLRLVTNRELTTTATKLFLADNDKAREFLIRKSSRSEVKNAAELARILGRTIYEPESLAGAHDKVGSYAAQFGVLADELPNSVDEMLGLLLRKASEAGLRKIERSDLLKSLIGFPNPYELLGDQSKQLRHDEIQQFVLGETEDANIVRRQVVGDIAASTLENPITVVTGDGGVGKSVAVTEALLGLMQSEGAPHFGLICKATGFDAERIMQSVATWRNLGYHGDGVNFQRSIDRLRIASRSRPILTMVIDGIDEKDGATRLPTRNQQFIRRQMREAEESVQPAIGHECAVVVSCRNVEELRNLGSPGFAPAIQPKVIDVAEFQLDGEFRELVDILPPATRSRLRQHLQNHDRLTTATTRSVTTTLSNAVSQEMLNAIIHPIMWRFFTELPADVQNDVLNGTERGVWSLASGYLGWLRSKAAYRLPQVTENELNEALSQVAISFGDDLSQVGEYEENWRQQCLGIGCSPVNVRPMFEEAVSAGLVCPETNRGDTWRWKHPWIAQYLVETKGRLT